MRLPPHSVELTGVTEWNDGASRPVQDALAAEEPLEIRADDVPVTITMRTPGNDTELAAGFLWAEGIVESTSQVEITQAEKNLVRVRLPDRHLDEPGMRRNFLANSSCGICGKATIEAIRRRGVLVLNGHMCFNPDLLCRLPELVRGEQAVFERTGGLHAAALFDREGNLLALREDIGRHNAVDKIVGWAVLQGRLPLSDTVLLVSGRGGFEIVQKAVAAGVPILASVSAPSSLAVKLARETGLTLVGFLRGRRFVIYAGDQRLAL